MVLKMMDGIVCAKIAIFLDRKNQAIKGRNMFSLHSPVSVILVMADNVETEIKMCQYWYRNLPITATIVGHKYCYGSKKDSRGSHEYTPKAGDK